MKLLRLMAAAFAVFVASSCTSAAPTTTTTLPPTTTTTTVAPTTTTTTLAEFAWPDPIGEEPEVTTPERLNQLSLCGGVMMSYAAGEEITSEARHLCVLRMGAYFEQTMQGFVLARPELVRNGISVEFMRWYESGPGINPAASYVEGLVDEDAYSLVYLVLLHGTNIVDGWSLAATAAVTFLTTNALYAEALGTDFIIIIVVPEDLSPPGAFSLRMADVNALPEEATPQDLVDLMISSFMLPKLTPGEPELMIVPAEDDVGEEN